MKIRIRDTNIHNMIFCLHIKASRAHIVQVTKLFNHTIKVTFMYIAC